MASVEIGESVVELNVNKVDEVEQKMVLDGVKFWFIEWYEGSNKLYLESKCCF